MIALCFLTLFMNLSQEVHLNLEATFGAADENLILGIGTRLAVADEDTLFVLDPSAFKVQVFDGDFQLQRAFGRKGKGPGEFEEPRSIVLTPQGNVVVLDVTLKRKSVFNAAGAYLDSTKFEAGIVTSYFTHALAQNKLTFVSAKVDQDGKPIYDLSIYDTKMEPLTSLARVDAKPLDWSQSGNPEFWVTFLASRFEMLAKPMPVVSRVGNDQLVMARTDQYQLDFYDLSGKKVGSAARTVKPKAFSEAAQQAIYQRVWSQLTADAFLANNLTQQVFDRAMQQVELPEALPMMRAIVPAFDGFAVLYNYDEAKQEGTIAFHKADGTLIGETEYRGTADFLTSFGDALYSVGFDANEDVVVQRHRMVVPR